ncbi:hypothetical protein [Chondromyces apiculatus]|uniref:Uncharacterized protein n=1 Tax=Chondromyces apiculatus DSM 436 TaxID=1192034 RepID=A0A017T9B5_9BACT|nr:hypothetical protein [Chondromyces apiculatus]EYF05834.1 Hypothetical protein CAP_2835 [Chondromyces apiculatus DSM 436]
MTAGETLLANNDCTIEAQGPLVLCCECQGAALDLGVRAVTTFVLVIATIVAGLVAVRAVPWPMGFIPATWVVVALVARWLLRRRRFLHGKFRVDFERGEITQEGRGFARRWPTSAIEVATLPIVTGPDADQAEPGMESRWLELHLRDGARLRLGKGPGHALRPAVALLRKAGLEVRA